jgi:Ring finger domain
MDNSDYQLSGSESETDFPILSMMPECLTNPIYVHSNPHLYPLTHVIAEEMVEDISFNYEQPTHVSQETTSYFDIRPYNGGYHTYPQCPICLDEFTTEDKVARLKCTHCFHPTCIKKWRTMHTTCPICRAPIN